MKQLFWILFSIASLQISVAQTEFSLKDSVVLSIKDSITEFSVDNLGNYYFVSENRKLWQYKPQTQQTITFNDWMEINQINTTNPFFITYTNSLYQLNFLDYKLNPIKDPINLFSEVTFQPNLITVIDSNWLWGWDSVWQKLILWNYNTQQTIQESNTISFKENEELLDLLFAQNQVYLATNQRLFVFDQLANVKHIYPLPEFDQIKINPQKIYFTFQHHLFLSEPDKPTPTPLEIKKPISHFYFLGNVLFVLSDKVVYIYDSKTKEH